MISGNPERRTPLQAAIEPVLIAGLHPMQLVRCKFMLREPVPGGFRYTGICLGAPDGQTCLTTPNPPLTGDIISLYDPFAKKGYLVRVCERWWRHSSWGSVNWPILKRLPDEPPLMEILCEETGDLYRDKVSGPEAGHPGSSQ